MCSFDELQVIESTAATSLPTANQHIKETARHCCSENDAFPSEMSFWRYFWNHTKAQQGCPLKQAACENVEKGICDHIIALAAAAPCRTAEIQTAARKQSKPNEPIHVLDNPGAGGGVVMLYSLGERVQHASNEWKIGATGAELRDGLIGRHVFTRGKLAETKPRCFEWMCRRDPGTTSMGAYRKGMLQNKC